MSRDLRSLLEEAGENEGRATRLDPADTERALRSLTAQVRRRRVVQGSAVGVGAAAALLVGALAVQGLEAPQPAPPATPEPTVVAPEPTPTQPSPSTGPEPTATPEPTAAPAPEVLGTVTVHPMLPSAEPLRAGMLEAAGPDWRLVTVAVGEMADPPPPVLYLVSPDGARFEVPTPVGLQTTSDPWGGESVLDWLPGSTSVLVYRATGFERGDYSVRDVLTGAVVGELPVPDDGWPEVAFAHDGTGDVLLLDRLAVMDGPAEVRSVVRLSPTGEEVARHGGVTVVSVNPMSQRGTLLPVSPGGARLALSTTEGVRILWSLQLSTGGEVRSPYPGRPEACSVVTWWGPDAVVLGCHDAVGDGSTPTGAAELWWAPVDGGQPALLTDEAEEYTEAIVVADRLVLSRWAPEGGFSLVAVAADGTVTPLPGTRQDSRLVHAVIGDRLLVTDQGDELVLLDPFTDTARTVVPTPAPSGLGVAGPFW